MGDQVWMQWFVQAVGFVSNLFVSSKNLSAASNGGALPNAQEKDAASISTSTNVTTLAVIRDQALATVDAHFGRMHYSGVFLGYSMERKAVAIPEGTYRGYKRDSAHFGMRVVGIDVPNRTDIECHPANTPNQVKGCIAVGSSIDNDALDNSKVAFDKMMLAVPQEFTVTVSSR